MRGRAAAAAAAACATLHVPLVLSHAESAPFLAAVMAVLTVLCLGCIKHLAAGPSPRTWRVMGTIAAAMALVHVPLVAGSWMPAGVDVVMAAVAHHGHGGAHGGVGTGDGMDMLMLITAGLAVVQVLIAGSALVRRPPAMTR